MFFSKITFVILVLLLEYINFPLLCPWPLISTNLLGFGLIFENINQLDDS